jgi:CDP-glucose 4,6-dehydratase
MGAAPIGVALPPQADPNLYTSAEVERCCRSHFCDVREEALLSEIVKEASPEVVFHLAAQPLVRYSYGHPVDTFSTNVMGTVHLLNILRDVETVRVVVVITTDKVYRNNEGFWAYRETDPLGGQDPYSASKSCCEMVVDSYRRSFLEERGVAVATARAGNVIGGGDWSEDRIIPDIVRAWRSGTVLKVRHPEAIRPWQHVLEPIYGYLTLAEKLWDTSSLAGAYNFGPSPYHSATVEKVLSLVQRDHRSLSVQVEFEESLLHESGTLLLDPSKAKMMLGVEPVWSLEEMFERTFSWYESYYKGEHAKELCLADIEALGVFG